VAATWITAREPFYGSRRFRAPKRKQTLLSEFPATFRVVGLDHPAAHVSGQNKSVLGCADKILAVADLMIAAIALAQGASLVTSNGTHYDLIECLGIHDWIRGQRD
jgi:tRNA(fMet)-specific endonuclease VapC